VVEAQGLKPDATTLQDHGWGHVASLRRADAPGDWFSPRLQRPG
jgi:hypothetical protein